MKWLAIDSLALVLFASVNIGNASKILGIIPMPSKSHSIVGCSLMKGLARAGHEITVITPFPENKNISNYREVSTESLLSEYENVVSNAMSQLGNVVTMFNFFTLFGTFITNRTFYHPNVQEIINDSNEKFDLIIMAVTLNEAMLGFGHYYQAPVIGFSTVGSSKWTNDMVGTPAPYSYNPNIFLGFTEKMTFMQRLVNTMFTTYEHLFFDWIYLGDQVKLYDDFFPNPKPPLSTLRKNVSLVLLNSHFSLNFPKPYAPNMIEVGGLNVNRDEKKLPTDIQAILDGATMGAIYFSLGTNVKSSFLSVEAKNDIMKAFAGLKQTVLWKFDEELKDKPKNVYISTWFPQDGILAHPNTILFITHGGLLSSTEALYHGVPTIGIPVLGDQELNVARAVQNGFCIKLAMADINEENLSNAIEEILSKKSYTERAKILSARFRDQPLKPMETAVYWVEYVIRHKGAPHMRNPGLDLNFFQYHSLDVYGTVVGAVLLAIYIIIRLLKFIVRFIVRRFSRKVKTN